MAEHILLLFQQLMKYLKISVFNSLMVISSLVMATIKNLFLYPRPHTFAPRIVKAASTAAVHALEDAVFRDTLTIGFTGILRSPFFSPL